MDFLIKKWSEKPINRLKKILPIKDHQYNKNQEKILKNIKNYNEKLIKLIEKIQSETDKNLVIGKGDFSSPIIIIGECGGEEENNQQIPFAGSNGDLLKKILNDIGINHDKVYITNIFFWQLNNNRIPNESELALTLPYIIETIKIQQPKLIITLGALATKTLLSTKESISGLRGTFQNITFDNNNYYDLFITFHPDYILRNNRYEDYLQDFLKIKNFLQDNNLYEKII